MQKALIIKKMKVSIILPTYNEKDNVVAVIKDIEHHIKSPFEILVVDDNSPDGTAQAARKLNKSNVRIIKRTIEKGLVSAIQRGIDEAKGNIIVWMDCDLSHPPHLLPLLLKQIEQEGYDIVIASRYVKGGKDTRPLLRRSYSIAINLFARLLLTYKITDYTTGFVAGRKEVFRDIRLKGNYGNIVFNFCMMPINMGLR